MATGNSIQRHLSYADGLATSTADILLLIGRVLLGWLFFKAGWDKLMNMKGFTGYLTNLRAPAPDLLAWPAMLGEMLIGVALILGFATRYAALVMIVFVTVATLLAHRYWEFPAQQQGNQFNHFLKNLALIGGALIVFVTGAGRFSLDAMLGKRR